MPSRHTTKLLSAVCAILCLSGSWGACRPRSAGALGEPLEEASCGFADDESALLQGRNVLKVDRTQWDWDSIKDAASEAVTKADGLADSVVERLTSAVNSTLQTISIKVDSFEEHATDAFAAFKNAKHDKKLLAFETSMTTTLNKTSTAWSSITEAVKLVGTAVESGLTTAGQDDIADNVKFMLGSALDSANSISQAIAEANRSVSGITEANISGSEAIVAKKLSKLNATLDEALEKADSFGQYFESAIGEFVDGIEEKLQKMGASLAQLTPRKPAVARPSAVSLKVADLSELNPDAIFDNFTRSSKNIAAKVHGAFTGIVGRARAAMVDLDLPPVNGFAWRAAPSPRFGGITASVVLAVLFGVRL
mmetsp:Transcript_78566/g.168353  ORF Transcript_78566/g.168353 Transcript_78566/m.168353 type:complete len:366 (-) Transcript_78566:49-1146(-)